MWLFIVIDLVVEDSGLETSCVTSSSSSLCVCVFVFCSRRWISLVELSPPNLRDCSRPQTQVLRDISVASYIPNPFENTGSLGKNASRHIRSKHTRGDYWCVLRNASNLELPWQTACRRSGLSTALLPAFSHRNVGNIIFLLATSKTGYVWSAASF